MATIYLVNSDPLIVDFVHFRLSRVGHDVHSSQDGHTALQEIRSILPDLVITAYLLPILNASEVLAGMQEQSSTRNIPVLVLADQWREKDVIQTLGSGISDYLCKPFSPEELLFRVNRALPSRMETSG